MAQQIVNLPLYPSPDYEYTIRLERQDINLRFYINERQNCYYLDIRDSLKNPIVLGTRLVPLAVLLEEPLLSEWGLSGYFFLFSFNQNITDLPEEPTALPEKFGLVYVFEE